MEDAVEYLIDSDAECKLYLKGFLIKFPNAFHLYNKQIKHLNVHVQQIEIKYKKIFTIYS